MVRPSEKLIVLVAGAALVAAAPAFAGPAAADKGAPKAPSGELPTWGELDAQAALRLPGTIERLGERPAEEPGSLRACSDRRPVCVHAAPGVDPRAASRALRMLEEASAATDALALPRPRLDGALGGDGRFDLYLVAGAGEPRVFADPGSTEAWGHSVTAFAIAEPPRSDACENASRLATALAEASLLALDGATDPGVLEMSGRYLATITSPCPTLELEDVDTFQRAPERCLVDDGGRAQRGSFLFPAYLDDRFGGKTPGAMAASLVAISDQPADTKKPWTADEPDFFDALRATFKTRETQFGQIMLDFQVSRAFVGSRSDGAHMPDVERFGDLGRVRVEWSVPYASLPRRVAPTRPVDALGATYVWLDLTGAPADAEITFAADWETPFLFRWTLVKIDKSGAESGRTDVAPIFGEYHAEKQIRDLGDAAGILVVGENDAEWSKNLPFDPGEPRLMPKSYTVTLYK